MLFRDALKKLQNSESFKSWTNSNKASFLSYGFIMKDPDVKEEWQIGYYNPDKDTVTSFSVAQKTVRNPESDIFKKNNILELELSKVKITCDRAMKISKDLQEKKYSSHSPVKRIILLQNLDIGQVWNITYITNTFKTLNIKVDSESGNIVKHDLIELFKFE